MKNISLFRFIGALLLSCFSSMTWLHAADPVKLPLGVDGDKFHLFLFVGQSNMAGRAKLEKQDLGVIDGVWLFNDQGQWEPAEPPLNRYSKLRKLKLPSRLNPALGFVKAYRKKFPDVQIGVVCSALGGSSIEQWEKGAVKDPKLYAEAIRAMKLAMTAGGKLNNHTPSITPRSCFSNLALPAILD